MSLEAFFGFGSWARVLCLAAAVFSTAGCKGDDAESGPPACTLPAGARGSAECHRWQTSLCNWSATCNASRTKCECFDQTSAISCISEAEATRCADGLDAATCATPPSGCDLSDLADPVAAQAKCQEFLTALCDLAFRCGAVDPAECMAEVALEIDCTTAVGAKPKLEQCLSALATVSCSASEGPTSCDGAILVSSL